MADPLKLGSREREILETVFRLDHASVAEVRDALADPPSYSAVRAILGKLERKGYLKVRAEGARYVYRPAKSRQATFAPALRQVVETLFDGSTRRTMAALLDTADDLSDAELARLRALIDAQAGDPS